MTEFLTTENQLTPYMIFPHFLLDSNLSETTKILYVILLDRTRLSMKNDGWSDEHGHVFIYFTISDMAAVLHKSEMTVKNCLSSLEHADLIHRKRQGIGIPNRIYVKVPRTDYLQTDKKLSTREIENYPPDRQKTVFLTDRKLSANKNNNIKNYSTNKRNTLSSYQINYDCKEYESL